MLITTTEYFYTAEIYEVVKANIKTKLMELQDKQIWALELST